jgi:RHS repeat-associated protein
LSNTNSSFTDRYQYTGREFDSVTGLQYNRARYYDPTVGRWTQEDPLGFTGGVSNLYQYVENAPLSTTDPMGLFGEDPQLTGKFKMKKITDAELKLLQDQLATVTKEKRGPFQIDKNPENIWKFGYYKFVQRPDGTVWAMGVHDDKPKETYHPLLPAEVGGDVDAAGWMYFDGTTMLVSPESNHYPKVTIKDLGSVQTQLVNMGYTVKLVKTIPDKP